jgi:hypothetical protein
VAGDAYIVFSTLLGAQLTTISCLSIVLSSSLATPRPLGCITGRGVASEGDTIRSFRWDIRDAFRIIPIAPSQHWLLGFQWQECFYYETVLLLLGTAPLLFNLFAEGFRWILLKARLHFLYRSLDDFVRARSGIRHYLTRDDPEGHKPNFGYYQGSQ